MKAEQLLKELKGKNPPTVVDVRTGYEYRAGHIASAINLPVYTILLRCRKQIPDPETHLVITCEHGPRAVLAQSFLALRGYRNVTLLKGHMLGWKRLKLPLEK